MCSSRSNHAILTTCNDSNVSYVVHGCTYIRSLDSTIIISSYIEPQFKIRSPIQNLEFNITHSLLLRQFTRILQNSSHTSRVWQLCCEEYLVHCCWCSWQTWVPRIFDCSIPNTAHSPIFMIMNAQKTHPWAFATSAISVIICTMLNENKWVISIIHKAEIHTTDLYKDHLNDHFHRCMIHIHILVCNSGCLSKHFLLPISNH